jgi:hypothetical protein
MNAKLGDKSAHWFMKGFKGAEIKEGLMVGGEDVLFRQRHMPSGDEGLATFLRGFLSLSKEHIISCQFEPFLISAFFRP